MKYYIIRETSKATESNKNFKNEKHIYFIGKGEEVLCKTNTNASWPFRRYMNDYLIKEYGYKRKCDAARNWCYKNPENTQSWSSKTEIISVNI